MSPQTHQLPHQSRPFVIDPEGSDILGEVAALREQGDVVRVELPGAVPAWSVTGFETGRRLLADPRVSKDPRRHWPAWTSGAVPADWPLAAWVTIRSMFTAYGAEHTRLRKLVSGSFTKHRTEALRPAVARITGELIDRLGALPTGQPLDLRREFAGPLPAAVIGELFRVPESLRPELSLLFHRLFDTSADGAEAGMLVERVHALVGKLITDKRARPGDDLTSRLIKSQETRGGFSDLEIRDTLVHLLSAGYETTVNLIDQAVHALLTHPEQLELARSGRASWSDVVEESLRWQAPAAHLMLRFAVEDIALGETTIRRGDAILVSVAAAGRDPKVHGRDADRFDITRPTRHTHLTFGHGVHFCMGAPLARMEATIALPALFERFPGLRLAVPPRELLPLPSFISNGHRRLPVLTGA
ncbi:cytochrome P450 [Streptomyces sp. NPDC041068]|uniref:cytochrome P450 family protein n=1 Tax=Streptomyces sp. NPDC041068 TaxID=3155130 RepID=UPI00340DE854